MNIYFLSSLFTPQFIFNLNCHAQCLFRYDKSVKVGINGRAIAGIVQGSTDHNVGWTAGEIHRSDPLFVWQTGV